MILALETATEVGGIALLEGERVLAERVIGPERPHAGALLSALDELLHECELPLDEVDRIALSIGPGSFTSLRIGLATALGLCFGTERQIVPVPTLAALSLRAGRVERIVPVLDARRGQVYTGLYGPGGVCLEPDQVCDPLPWLEGLGPGPLHLLGPGVSLYKEEIVSILGDRAQLLPAEQGWPRASCVGVLGAQLERLGASLTPEKVELRYLRKADAEERGGSRQASGKPII